MSRTGRKLLNFDRRFGARFVAGADEAGRGSLAGPLVAAGVLLDYDLVRGRVAARLASLNDSKQLDLGERERLFRAVLRCASRVAVEVVPPVEIDRVGLHRSNLDALARALTAISPPAEICLSDGFRLGLRAPAHQHVVEGDSRSASIAAASIVAKVVRDRMMRRFDRLYPEFGFMSHVGYITPDHAAVVRARGPTDIHRMSFRALCYAEARAKPGPGRSDRADEFPGS
ncbi:MAG: ribonuclease HII [Gaiellales bacterium]